MTLRNATLSNWTPVEIDTALAEIYQRLYKVWDEQERVQRYLDDHEKGMAALAAGNRSYSTFTEEGHAKLVAKMGVLVEQAHEILAETRPYQAEFKARGGWTRFYHVTNSNGHIHSSMHCSTCFPTTRYAWLTEMSGQSEADALEALGKQNHVLCSVCYPNAPVWMFSKRQDPNVCEGSGEYLHSDLPHRSGYMYGNWATCSVCGGKPALTKALRLRKHVRGYEPS